MNPHTIADDEPFEEEDAQLPATPKEARTHVQTITVEAQRVLVIESEQQANALGDYLSSKVQPAIKRVKDLFTEPKRKADEAKAALLRAERELLEPLEKIKADAKVALARWADTMKRLAKQREQQLIEQAQRVAAELRENEAKQLEAEGEHELAQEVREEAPVVVPAVSTTAAPRIRGARVAERWVCELTDIKQLCRAIADGTVPETAVSFNQGFANRHAQDTKGKVVWPGTTVHSTTSVGLR